jgi:hypothetical protein
MEWARILAYVTGTVDQELLAWNEYLAAENRILQAQLKGRLNLSHAERATLGEIGHRLGRKAPRRGRNCGEAGDDPGLVPQVCRPQVRWLESPSRPGQTTGHTRGPAVDRSHRRGEP